MNQDLGRIHFVEKFFRQALKTLDISEQDQSDQIAFRKLHCPEPSLMSILVGSLKQHFQSLQIEVDHLDYSALRDSDSALVAAQDAIDRIHGEGAFLRMADEVGFVPPFAELLRCSPRDFDAFLDRHWIDFNAYRWSARCVKLIHASIEALTQTHDDRKSRVLIIQQPRFADRTCFNFLYNLFIRLTRLGAPVYNLIIFALDEEHAHSTNDPDADMFFKTLHANGVEQQAFTIHSPPPHALYRLFLEFEWDDDLAREKALDVSQFLVEAHQEKTPLLSPRLWLEAYEKFVQNVQSERPLFLATYHDESKVPASAIEAGELADELRRSYVLCNFEDVLRRVQGAALEASPLLQYLDLIANYPTNAHRYPEWADAWLATSGAKSRFVSAALHRELWFHKKDREREALYHEVLENHTNSETLILQLVCSWILTLWRASHVETMALGKVFLKHLETLSSPIAKEIAEDLASIIVLNQVVIEPDNYEKPAIQKHIHRLFSRRLEILNYAPQLTTELCFLLDYLWNNIDDPEDYNLLELSHSDYETRTCYNRFVTLSIFVMNLASGLAKNGFYGEATRYERSGLILAERTQNERDIGFALLGTVFHICSSAALLELNEEEIHRGFDCLIRKSGSMENVLHYYQLTLWNLFTFRSWDLCSQLLEEASRFVVAHSLENTKDAEFLLVLRLLLDFQKMPPEGSDSAILSPPAMIPTVHANYAGMSHFIYSILHHYQTGHAEAINESVTATEKYLQTFKQRIADSEISILMQTLIHCKVPWKGSALSIAKFARLRYVETFTKAFPGFVEKKLYAESPKALLLLAAPITAPILDQEIWLYVAESFSRISDKSQLTYSFCLAMTALLDPIRLIYSAEKNIFYDIHRRDDPIVNWQTSPRPVWNLSEMSRANGSQLPAAAYALDLNVFAPGQTVQLHFRSEQALQQCRHFFEKSSLGKFILNSVSSRFAEIQNLRSNRQFRILAKKQTDMMRKSTIEMSELLNQERKGLRETVAELQKQHVSRMKLYASLFHDIKSPAQRTVEKLREALLEKNQSLLPGILNQCLHQQSGIVDKLDWILLQSTSGLDARPGKKTSHSLKALLDRVCEQFYWEANRLQIDFMMGDVDARIVICAVAEDVEIILVNILSNALRFTPPGGLVRLKTSVVGEAVLIEVEDNGIGMSQAQIESLGGAPDSQAMSFGSSTKGSGLGLTIVRSLLEDQEGRLSIESEPGKYTRVSIKLPLDSSAVEAFARSDASPETFRPKAMPLHPLASDHSGPSVLIIEPDHSIRDNLAKGLEGSYIITKTSDGHEALRLIQKNEYDFIVCNYEIKPVGGIELLDRHSSIESRPRTFFIMTATSDQLPIREASLEGGAIDFIPFPFSSHELKQRLQNLMVRRTPDAASENEKPNILLYRNYREYLLDCFQNKKDRRPSFSHRRLMQLVNAKSPSFFKRIVDGDVIVTSDMAMRLAQVFSLNELEKELFFAMVSEGREGDGQSKNVMRAKEKIIRSLNSQRPRPLSALIQNSVWPGIILLLTRARTYDGTAAWISSHLGGTLPTHAIQAILDSFQRQGILGQAAMERAQKSSLIEIEETGHAIDSLTSLQELVRMCLDRSSIQAINILFPRRRHKEIMALVEEAWIDFCSALRSLGDDDEDEGDPSNVNQDLCHIALITAPCPLNRSDEPSM